MDDGLLPLQLGNKPVIAVIGANATQTMASGGFGAGVKTLYEVTPLEGLKKCIEDKAEIIFAQGYEQVKFSFGNRFGKRTPEELESIFVKSLLINPPYTLASKIEKSPLLMIF